MKKIIYIALFSLGIICSAQVGVNTDSPQTTLDINGDLNVSNAIYLNDSNRSAGTQYQFITSGGANEAAKWTDKKMPKDLEGSLSTSFINSFADRVGVQFDNNSAGDTVPYSENELLNHSAGWKEIPGVEVDFEINKTENKVNLFFQTMVQFTGESLGSFACGFFINDNPSNKQSFRLKGVRTDVMMIPSGSYKLFNINSVINNLPPDEYTIKFACIKRNISGNNKIAIGRPLTNVLNNDMTQSSLSISVLEAY